MFVCCWALMSQMTAVHAKPQVQTLQDIVNNTLWITEDYPPFHYRQGANKKGLALDILDQLFQYNDLGFERDKQIVVFPWARAVKEISGNAEAALLTMAYTPERDNLFVLSEPLFEEQIALITLQDSPLQLTDINDIERVVIGVVRDDIGERLLKDVAPEELHLVHVFSSKELLQMLIRKRVDAIAYSLDIIQHQLQQHNGTEYQLKVQLNLAQLPTSIAFNKQANPMLIEAINKAIIALKQDGSIARIMTSQ